VITLISEEWLTWKFKRDVCLKLFFSVTLNTPHQLLAKMKAKHETASQPQTNEIFNLSVLPSADN
jgi:hypothetical protein